MMTSTTIMNDTQLLHDYVSTGSESAFAELVRRHIDLVYAAARRQTRDAHLAEDVTQTVFILLAQKAGTLRGGAVLPAWLLSCARYTAVNLNRQELLRRQRTKAASMASTSNQNAAQARLDPANEDFFSTTLDDALNRLKTIDRAAVALRYLQDKSFSEVASAMNISEEAARKRVARAIDKLRDYFVRRGLVTDATAFTDQLSRPARYTAPASLAPIITTKALSGASATSAGAGVAGHFALRLMAWTTPAKLAAAASIAIVITAGAVMRTPRPPSRAAFAAPPAGGPVSASAPVPVTLSAIQIWQPYTPSTARGASTRPIANFELRTDNSGPNYYGGLDAHVIHDGRPAATVKSLRKPPKNSGGYLNKIIDAASYHGKRIRLAGDLKCQNVANQASMALWVIDDKRFALAQDDMGGHWLYGTHDWQRFDIVEDVPANAKMIYVNIGLIGTGTIWADGLQLDVVGNDVPTNDDHRWRSWTPTPAKYTTSLDSNEQHNGHATIRVTSDSAERGDWNTYDHTIPDIAPYRGKRVKFSAMIKAKDVQFSAGPIMRLVGPMNSTAKRDSQFGHRPIVGSVGWMKYATTLDVPKDAMGFSAGVTLNGRGTLWIDDVKLEIIK